MDNTSIAASKDELRARMLETRTAIDPVQRLDRAAAIHEHLYELSSFKEADSVGLYWAGGSEVSVSSVGLQLAEVEGRRIFLPFILNGELELTEWRPQDPVVDAEYGSMHPRFRRKVALEEVGALLVPGLAFDRHGNRLGSGTGHYDRLLARLDPRTVRIGVCFGEQIEDGVPHDENDQPVQFLATDGGVIACATVSGGALVR